MTGHSFFPQLITQPFHDGLVVAFWFAIAVSVIAAIASAFTGKTKAERASRAPRAGRMEPPEGELAWASAEDAGAEEGGVAEGGAEEGGVAEEAGVGAGGAVTAGAAAAEAAISGVVSRPDGAPAVGVTVTALNFANAVADTTVTGTDGCYLLHVPSPGDYVVVAAGLRAREVSLDAGAGRDTPVLLRIGERS
jgi:hypothetical protein